MYVAVRRYEGVSDSQKVAQLVDEGFIPIISEMPGFVAFAIVRSAVRRLSLRRRPDAAKHSRGPGAPLWACRCPISGRSRPYREARSPTVLRPASLQRAARHAHLR